MTTQSPEQLVVDFLNTVDVEVKTDRLDDPVGWKTWAHERDLTAGDLSVARQCRDALRARALPGGPLVALPAVALVPVMNAAGGIELTAADAPDDVSGRVLAAVILLSVQGRLDRVKICPADDCRWAFYDESRNGSRQWCSMAVCGNRAKTKAFRHRAQQAE